jgi:hypothetical protein
MPGSGVRTVGLPVSFDGKRPPLAGAAPALGQHQNLLDQAIRETQ